MRERAARDLLRDALDILKTHAIGGKKQEEIEKFFGDK